MTKSFSIPKRSIAPTIVDPKLTERLLEACRQGDIDACHLTLLKLQQLHPESFDALQKEDQPLYDIIGHGFVVAAVHNHVDLLEFLVSSTASVVLRDGMCGDATRFTPFAATANHELKCCVYTIRYIVYAALACVDQVAMSSFQYLVDSKALWGFEVAMCLSLAMRRAVAMTEPHTSAQDSALSPMVFHPMIVLLTRHFDCLIEDVRAFHFRFSVSNPNDTNAVDRYDRVKALQASLLYTIACSDL